MTSSTVWSDESNAIADVRMITLSNNKGGSGKTTTTVSLAAALAELGLRILVIDLDPQGSATMWLGGRESSTGLVEFSEGAIRISELVRTSTAPRVDLVPTSPSLVPSGDESDNMTGLAIVRAFRRLPDYWDLVLIDTPPTLGYLSLAPLVVSDHIVIPVEAHALAMPGVAMVTASIERARRRVNPHVELLGIVACRVNSTSHVRDVVARLRAQFGNKVFEHTVREAIRIAEAPAFRLPITRYAPTSPVANDYRAIAVELLSRLGDLNS
jgi:chromosome partitioning protein